MPIFFAWLLSACEALHPLIYNMTPCPVTVIYSTETFQNFTVDILPGRSIGTMGGKPSSLENLVIKDARGGTREYPKEALSKLRSRNLFGTDQWGLFPDGLRFLGEAPSQSQLNLPVQSECKAQR
jgi:hypothetical protein